MSEVDKAKYPYKYFVSYVGTSPQAESSIQIAPGEWSLKTSHVTAANERNFAEPITSMAQIKEACDGIAEEQNLKEVVITNFILLQGPDNE